MNRPLQHEYPKYFNRYISLVPEGDILSILDQQQQQTLKNISRFSEEVGVYRYEPDKWSIKEVYGHIIDTERVFAYRALCFARDHATHLPSMDQDIFADAANYHSRTLIEIADEFRIVREGTLALLSSFNQDLLMKIGSASDYKMSVRSIPFILAGHEFHHGRVIEERYVKKSM